MLVKMLSMFLFEAIPFQRARARQPGRSVFDGFRDFQAETSKL